MSSFLTSYLSELAALTLVACSSDEAAKGNSQTSSCGATASSGSSSGGLPSGGDENGVQPRADAPCTSSSSSSSSSSTSSSSSSSTSSSGGTPGTCRDGTESGGVCKDDTDCCSFKCTSEKRCL